MIPTPSTLGHPRTQVFVVLLIRLSSQPAAAVSTWLGTCPKHLSVDLSPHKSNHSFNNSAQENIFPPALFRQRIGNKCALTQSSADESIGWIVRRGRKTEWAELRKHWFSTPTTRFLQSNRRMIKEMPHMLTDWWVEEGDGPPAEWLWLFEEKFLWRMKPIQARFRYLFSPSITKWKQTRVQPLIDFHRVSRLFLPSPPQPVKCCISLANNNISREPLIFSSSSSFHCSSQLIPCNRIFICGCPPLEYRCQRQTDSVGCPHRMAAWVRHWRSLHWGNWFSTETIFGLVHDTISNANRTHLECISIQMIIFRSLLLMHLKCTKEKQVKVS